MARENGIGSKVLDRDRNKVGKLEPSIAAAVGDSRASMCKHVGMRPGRGGA
jgi:hypothetical protein